MLIYVHVKEASNMTNWEHDQERVIDRQYVGIASDKSVKEYIYKGLVFVKMIINHSM